MPQLLSDEVWNDFRGCVVSLMTVPTRGTRQSMRLMLLGPANVLLSPTFSGVCSKKPL